nr:reverse transcriptase domain-containing protein [Tanacetum cinerariifolium]
MNTSSSLSSGSLPSNTVPNPREDLKAITTQSAVTLARPSVSPPPPPSKEVDQEPETITNQVLTGSTNNVPPLVIQPSPASTSSTPISSPKIPESNPHQPPMAQTQVLIDEPVVAPKSKPTIPYPLLNNKEKLFDLATTLVNENCSTKAFFLELTYTQMILELVDRSTTRPVSIAEDIFVKVGKFHFPTDFVVVDYLVDPCIPLILRRPFLRTGRALIDVYGEELTLRVDDEAITFKVDKTSKYSYNDAESINRIDVIDVACEEYVQEVLGFFNNSKSGSPIPTSDPIISSSSPSFTPFEGSDFIQEEIETFLRTPDELSNLDDDYYDTEGDILYLEKLLNEDPSPNLPPVKTKDLKQVDATMTKPLIEEPPELELKELSSHLEYAFLEGTDKLPVITSKELKDEEKSALFKDDFKPTVQHQRRVNLKIHEVIKKEVIKLLDAGLIYPISDSPWVSPGHCVPKKCGMTVVENEDNELIPTRLVTGWKVCIDYRKLNDATRKDHFPLPFIDQMLERLAGNEFYCFLDGFSGYFKIPIDPQDQEKTTFTCPYGTFAYRLMPFGLCNAPGTFERCMMAIFYDMIEKTMEVFMDDFSVFGDSFSSFLSHLDQMLQRCEDTNLVLNWEKCHFMVKEGIVLGHKIYKSEIEVMSTLAYVDSETITHVDGSQNSRVPVQLPDDPYVVVRQAHLVDIDTESELKEAPLKAEELQPLGSRVLLMSEKFEASEP